ncbi:MAG TPA: SGNH/GDSL hydrolase family protein [Anaerolineales bacterium]|nr:SGNH/GDSL hydrolase family protein [Anaerolineales bacterium]
MTHQRLIGWGLGLTLTLVACQATSSSAPASPSAGTSTPAVTEVAAATAAATAATRSTSAATERSEDSTQPPASWQDWPILPTVSEAARAVYQRGLQLGNDSAAFSKVGDCGSSPSWFLGVFDQGDEFYRLGDYSYLSEVIAAFPGSFERTSVAARSGFNASSVFSPLWSDPKVCEPGEGPLACEYRIHRPSLAFIMLGTNDRWHKEDFEARLREIVEYTIERGIVPILSTKPDNLEGDGSLNAAIVRVAADYEVPLWNEWRAMQPLPNHGLQADAAHLTWEPNWFDNPVVMRSGWPVRNLTALQTLDVVWRGLTDRPPAQEAPTQFGG